MKFDLQNWPFATPFKIYGNPPDPGYGGSIGYGDIERGYPEGNKYFYHTLLGYSDYCGSLIERVNVECLEKYCDENAQYYFMAYGGYGTICKNIVMRTAQLCFKIDHEYSEELIEMIYSLDDYPLLDDDLYYQRENELLTEYWRDEIDWALRDLECKGIIDIDPGSFDLDSIEIPEEFWNCAIIETGAIPYADFDFKTYVKTQL